MTRNWSILKILVVAACSVVPVGSFVAEHGVIQARQGPRSRRAAVTSIQTEPREREEPPLDGIAEALHRPVDARLGAGGAGTAFRVDAGVWVWRPT